MTKLQSTESSSNSSRQRLVHRHLIEGWGGLALFSLLGLALELCLAFKVSFYLRADQQTLRLMWRLAHAHGSLLAVVHLGYAWTLTLLGHKHIPQPAGLISGSLTAATLLLPSGFFLGGLGAQDGDPGIAIFLVPAGALLFIYGLLRLVVCLLRE